MKLDEACNLAIDNMDKSKEGLIVPQIMMYGDGDWDGVAKIAEIAKKDNKKYMIVVVSEGAIEKEGKLIIKKVLEDSSGLDNIRLRRSR